MNQKYSSNLGATPKQNIPQQRVIGQPVNMYPPIPASSQMRMAPTMQAAPPIIISGAAQPVYYQQPIYYQQPVYVQPPVYAPGYYPPGYYTNGYYGGSIFGAIGRKINQELSEDLF